MVDYNKTKKELLQLYKEAKDAYYTGEEIMSDIEFDELEEYLGLSNKSKVGTRHNEKYTEKHPVIMGSLSKVQVKENKDGIIDWDDIFTDTKSYMFKYSASSFIVTPKFDGLSFEAYIQVDPQNNVHRVISISSRGDGEYGQNWMEQLYDKVEKNFIKYIQYKNGERGYFNFDTKYTLRGEVLIDKNIYLRKYADEYANPRSFVSGIMGKDYDKNDKKYLEAIKDLDIVIYDVKVMQNEGISDYDWTMFPQLIDKPDYHEMIFSYIKKFNVEDFKNLYHSFAEYRKRCKYALDGFVIKPVCYERRNDFKAIRQKDCIAIKFMPMLQETEIIDISWNLGKTGEYIPTIITNPIEMDGKQISRASASNYGKLITDKISIGTKVILSLAGDIIPFIYKVTNTDNFSEDNLNLPTEYDTYINDCHLMAVLNDNDKNKLNFITSVINLNIPNLGPALAIELYNYLNDKANDDFTADFFGIEKTEAPDNILFVSPEDIAMGIGGKNGEKIKKDFVNVLHQLTLKDIIMTCNFAGCGSKIAEQCVNYLVGANYDFSHLSEKAYNWVYDKESAQYKKVLNIVESFGKQFSDFAVIETEEERQIKDNQIPVILTGEPNEYASKGEFLKCHPEYRLTGKWTEVKIVFTNSLESNTGKMKKAREKGIEIKLY